MQRFRSVGFVRLASLAVGAMLLWLAFKGLAWLWVLLPVTVFFLLGEVQGRIEEARRRCERAAALYEQGLARLDDLWAGKGAKGDRFQDDAHPYAADLDLFGHGSLFELLSRARTLVGEETLARWLLQPATPEVVRARQAAVSELRPRLDLREDLALLGEGVHSGKEAHALAEWANASPWPIPLWLRVTAIGLALLAVVTFVLWIVGFGWLPLLFALIMGRLFAFRYQKQVNLVISHVDAAARELALLSGVLRRLEQERFSSPRLAELRAALDVEGLAPSQQIARLNRLIDLLDARRNMMFAPVAMLVLWPVQLAIAIERWRQSSGPAVGRWLAAVGELEALSSLANYSYERPEDPFPELVEGAARFEGEGLGHPLIPEPRNVRTESEPVR